MKNEKWGPDEARLQRLRICFLVVLIPAPNSESFREHELSGLGWYESGRWPAGDDGWWRMDEAERGNLKFGISRGGGTR
ncbi:hypothetical protein SBV1_3510003 [Verrucomicrobia bacterium]|nr:hypothetical protein SBV1_3510003 [Verrucomicrobiota bacterium]